VAGALLLSGCRVDTRVSVVEHTGGSGTVGVTLTFDDAAVKALGGQTTLAEQLQYADLESAGWKVSGPTVLGGGGASVTVTHGFSNTTQLSQLMSELAGSSSAYPFRLGVSDTGGFWTDKTVVTGTVDLRCGLDCFGDPGLQSALGTPLGVAPQPIEGAAGETSAQVFHFDLAVRLPGRPGSLTGNPVVARDGTLTWTVPLGSAVAVGAVSESIDWAHVILASVLAGLLVLGGGLGGWRLQRRRRRKSAPGDVELVPAPVGEPIGAEPGGDVTAWPRV
jgi:hypothetical protein